MPKHDDLPSLASIQPVVLVGGRSTRFGRDKLREPWPGSEGGTWLVDQPRRALARAFDGPVWAVGECDPLIAARFERTLSDAQAGAGPISGIVAALRASAAAVFVLSGDLPAVTAEVVLQILAEAHIAPGVDAVLATSDSASSPSLEPCIGLYRRTILPRLEASLAPGKTVGLHRLLAGANVLAVPIEARFLRNANEPGELR